MLCIWRFEKSQHKIFETATILWCRHTDPKPLRPGAAVTCLSFSNLHHSSWNNFNVFIIYKIQQS